MTMKKIDRIAITALIANSSVPIMQLEQLRDQVEKISPNKAAVLTKVINRLHNWKNTGPRVSQPL